MGIMLALYRRIREERCDQLSKTSEDRRKEDKASGIKFKADRLQMIVVAKKYSCVATFHQ